MKSYLSIVVSFVLLTAGLLAAEERATDELPIVYNDVTEGIRAEDAEAAKLTPQSSASWK